jgi:NAD(P)H-hydrate epimerase
MKSTPPRSAVFSRSETTTLDRRQTREVDRRTIEEYGLPGIVLMENAGRGVVERIVELKLPGPYLICCGKGNNAGDGFVIARHLDNLGQTVRVLVWADAGELRGDAQINFNVLQHSGILLELLGRDASISRLRTWLADCGCVIDALLGTGATGEPRPPLDTVIDEINTAGKPIVAVDLPSGLDCDTGQAAQHTIRAAHTCTFVALKPGFLVPAAQQYTGQVHVISIGAPRRVLAEVAR